MIRRNNEKYNIKFHLYFLYVMYINIFDIIKGDNDEIK